MTQNTNYIVMPCLEVKQPIGTFFIGAMSATDLVDISYSDIRELEEGRELDSYLGIERQLSKTRVKRLQQYVNNVDAAFPNSVILAIPSARHAEDGDMNEETLVEYDPKERQLKIKRDQNVAKIIDGQHRIAGLEGLSKGTFEVNVTIFVDMDIEDQAMVFATINLEHQKVSKSLQYDLYEYAKLRSPQKTCHNIARLLNKKDSSPFYHRIKILGTASGPNETLTQAALIDRLLPHITRNAMKDRDLVRRGKSLEHATGEDKRKLFLRDFFIDEQDAVIARIMWNYFSAVRLKWPRAWDTVERGNILNRTTGFAALMRFLKPAYLHLEGSDRGIVTVDRFGTIFRNIEIKDSEFTPDNYKPGSSGAGLLFRQLLEQSGLSQD